MSHCIFRSEKDNIQGQQNLSFILILNEIHLSNPSIGSKCRRHRIFLVLVNVLYVWALIVWAPLTLKVRSRSLEHIDLRSRITAVPNLNKEARLHRLVHSIESKPESTPCMSEVLASKVMVSSPLFDG